MIIRYQMDYDKDKEDAVSMGKKALNSANYRRDFSLLLTLSAKND